MTEISHSDILLALGDLKGAVGKLDGKLEAALQNMNKHDQQIEKLQAQVDSLSRWRAYVVGISTAVGFGIDKLVTYLHS